MRPDIENLKRPSRKVSENAGLLGPLPLGYNTPTSCRMAKEQHLEKARTEAQESVNDNTYGVRSLRDTIHEASSARLREDDWDENGGDVHGGRRRSTLKPVLHTRTRDSSRSSAKGTVRVDTSSPAESAQANSSPPSMSQSLTSLSLDSQALLSSLPSTPKSTSNRSLRPSDEESMEDGGSQAAASSDDDENEPLPRLPDSSPEFIMPSIKMPSRRPFTSRGKMMGRFKVLVAGDSGTGKTSLINAIVQTCEDIVHIDPVSPNPPSIDTLSKIGKNTLKAKPTQQITEIFASTKPYPSWWSDIEDIRVLRGPKNIGDAVLERNLCFVDTPGYSNGMSRIENMQSTLEYIEAQLTKPFTAPTATEGDITGLLSGSGGSQVDVILYFVAQEVQEEDLTFLKRLAAITNVIPLIAKSDLQSAEEIEMLRRTIGKLSRSDIGLLSLRTNNAGSVCSMPFSVCSAVAEDDENMDASLLMSSQYVQPLMPSELVTLVQHVFDPENMAYMRYLAAKKLVHARGSRVFSTSTASLRPTPPLIDNPSITAPNCSASSVLSQTFVLQDKNVSPYVQARLHDHTQREEKLAQIRLAKWASDLQSLQNERMKYEAIARKERALWLNERLEAIRADDALILTRTSAATAQEGSETITSSEMYGKVGHPRMPHAGDPLGLFRWRDVMRRRGWIALQVASGFGILGAIAVWVSKTLGAGGTDCSRLE